MLAVLFILYLIKPKPVNQTIPSLMFLLQDKGRAFRNSFLRYLYRDFVFLLQILILTILIAALCQPYISVAKTSFVGNSVIVIDTSASMQTTDGRWADAIKQAKGALSGQNTIIAIQNRPVVLTKSASRGDAEKILNSLKPSDTETNLYSAIIAAHDYIQGADTIVTVISDFRNTDDQQDYTAAVSTLQGAGAAVKLIPVGTSTARNVGIISVDVADNQTKIGVANYASEATVATLTAGALKQDIPLAAGSTGYLTINTPAGITQLSLNAHDDFPLDDTAVIVNNKDFSVRILIVTNNKDIEKTPLWYALQAINEKTPLNLSIDINNPPALANPKDYDIVIFSDVDPKLLVQRTVRDAEDNVNNGGSVIITYSDDMWANDFSGLIPYQYKGDGGASGVILGEFSSLTQDIDFGDVQHYYKVSGTGGRVLAQTSDNQPIISLIPQGKGYVLYYGIDDTSASFPLEPYYPVFWKRVLDTMGGRLPVEQLNVKTGSIPIGFSGVPTKTPGNTDYNGFFDHQGVYDFSNNAAGITNEVGVTLSSAAESNVAVQPLPTSLVDFTAKESATLKEKDLTGILAIIALALLFLELFIVKFRGDF